MKKKPLTNAEGEVRELTSEDIHGMRRVKEVLPAALLKTLSESRGQCLLIRGLKIILKIA